MAGPGGGALTRAERRAREAAGANDAPVSWRGQGGRLWEGDLSLASLREHGQCVAAASNVHEHAPRCRKPRRKPGAHKHAPRCRKPPGGCMHCAVAMPLAHKGPGGAGSAFRAAIAAGPNCALPRAGLGTIFRTRKDMVSAGGAYRGATAADPNCAVARCLLGNLLLDDHKDVASAESAYRDAIAADPTFADAHNNLGYLLQYERKDVAGAGGAYRDAIAADPKLVEAHNNLEYLLNNMKNFN